MQACVLGIIPACVGLAAAGDADPLPSWIDGASKLAIVRFVGDVSAAAA